jgi:uncharacterized membrane protein
MKNNPISSLIIFILLVVITTNACKHDTIAIDKSATQSDTVYFSDVLPIFVSNCATTNCHVGTGEMFALNSYSSIMDHVQAGSSYNSEVYKVITSVYLGLMPPDKPLTTKQRTLIKLWIDQGAKNNTAPEPVVVAPEVCDTSQANVLQIINQNCYSCHNAATASGGIKLIDLAGISLVAQSGLLLNAITGTGVKKMPLNGSLIECQITSIKGWIKNISPIDTSVAVNLGYACFTRDILPIIMSNCASATGCHENTVSNTNHHIYDYASVVSHVIPNDYENSLLYQRLTSTDIESRMPYKKTPLSKANIDSIKSWISHGANDGQCVSACDTSHYAFTANVLPIIILNCKGCHSGTTPNRGVKLFDYSTISVYAKNGSLVNVISGTSPSMPKYGSLSQCDITVIKKWVKSGALNN